MGLPEKIADSTSIVQAIMNASSLYGDSPAMLTKDSRGEYSNIRTYRDLADEIYSLASGMIHNGFPEQGRAGILSSTRARWNIADLAAQACGGATVGIYSNDNEDSIIHKINDSEISFVFVDRPERLEIVSMIPPGMTPSLKKIVALGRIPDRIDDERVIHYDALTGSDSLKEDIRKRIEDVEADTPARIVYTSGMSGRPKGAVLTHKNIMTNACTLAELIDIHTDDICLAYLPTAHILQTIIAYLVLFSGASLAYCRKGTFAFDLAAVRPTILPGVPRTFMNLLDLISGKMFQVSNGEYFELNMDVDDKYIKDALDAAGLDRIRMCISGAAKLDPEVEEIFEKKLGLTIIEGYGMSETSPVISVNMPGEKKPGTVGRIIPGLDVKIVDEEGRQVLPGHLGEVAVRGDSVFSGYLNLNTLNMQVISSDGFFFTGDIGIMDHDGYLKIVGRKGSRVKFANGEYYDLEEIGEKFLDNCSLIGQIAVAGEQRDYPVAVISLAEDLDVPVRYADSMGISYSEPYELVYKKEMIDAVRDEFHEVKKRQEDLHPLERVHKAIYIRPFSPVNKEATATGQARLKKITAIYKAEIESLYENEEDDFVVLEVGRLE